MISSSWGPAGSRTASPLPTVAEHYLQNAGHAPKMRACACKRAEEHVKASNGKSSRYLRSEVRKHAQTNDCCCHKCLQ